MESVKQSVNSVGAKMAVRKAFDDVYEALFEQPVAATQEELHAMSRTLRDNMPLMEKHIRDSEFSEEALRTVTFMAHAHESGDYLFPEDIEAGQMARRIVYENRGYILQRALESERQDGAELFRSIEALEKDPQYQAGASAIIGEEIKKAGFDYEKLRTLWQQASNPLDKESALQIMRLEHRIPGLPRTLNREFGIVNFRRYPESVLVKQYEMRDRYDVSYGVLLYPIDDHNGAFQGNGESIAKFADSLQNSYELRIVECDGKLDVAKQLITLDRRYAVPAGGHKISFAVIGGHGNEGVIVFGGNDDRHRLFKSDLQGKGVGRAASFFTENPTLIIVSCSTGKEGAIAQELSLALHATVIAPDGNTKLDDMRYDAAQNDFAVSYAGVQTIRYREGKKLE